MRSEYRLGRGTCIGPQSSAGRPDFVGRNLSSFGETIGGVDVLRRLRAEWPEDKLIVVWDGASYHRACVVREAAEALNIDLVPLPGYLHAGRACRSRRSGAGSGRMSPIITAIPPPRISAAGWPLSKHASIRTPAPSLTDSGSKITSTPTKKNYASQGTGQSGEARIFLTQDNNLTAKVPL